MTKPFVELYPDGSESEVWGDILHPDSLAMFGRHLLRRAETAQIFHTGIDEWDKACDDTGGGLDDFWYVVIGGASNVGKTQIILSLAQRALRQGFAVAFLTMEEPMDQIQRRVYASLSTELGYYDFTYAKWNQAHIATLEKSVPYLGKLVVSDEMKAYDLPTIIGCLDEVRDKLFGRPMVVFMDHLQLVHAQPGQSIPAAATEVSEGLRHWAKHNRTLTFAASQIVTEVVRSGNPPRAHDLWGGNAMYSNPSQVLVLDHTAKTSDAAHPHILRLWALLDKNRYGPKNIAIPIEANLRTGIWRGAQPDEMHMWDPNPWGAKARHA